MIKKLCRIFTVAALCCFPVEAVLAQGETLLREKPEPLKLPPLENHKPLVDFSSWTEQDGTYLDQTGNAVLTPGKNMKMAGGPCGLQAFVFDGLKTGAAVIDFQKIAAKFDGFDFSLSLWFRCDEFQNEKADARLAGNSPVNGLTVTGDDSAHFSMKRVGTGDLSAWLGINKGRWNHLAVIYSVEKRIQLIYINGNLVSKVVQKGLFYPLSQKNYSKLNLGRFKGAVAGLQLWDKAIPPEQFLEIAITPEIIKELKGAVAKVLADSGNVAGMKMMADSVNTKIAAAETAGKLALEEYNRILLNVRLMERLTDGTKALAGTALAKTPFAVAQVRAVSSEIRTPLTFPTDPEFTGKLQGIAAKGESVSLSYLIFPYKDMEALSFDLPDLKDRNGNTIGKENLELKYVQCWYQPGWNSYFNGHGAYVPSLLLNDPTLLKIDEKNQINYLKFHYPNGIEYHNVCIPGSVLKEPAFLWAFEPVWDADTLQPATCQFGRNCQYWLVVSVPENTKAGDYTGMIALKEKGETVGQMPLTVRVLPFSLPRPMTQFDHSKPFIPYLCSGMQIAPLTEILKDPARAEEMTWENVINQQKHSMFVQTLDILTNNISATEKTIAMHRKAGLDILAVNGGSACSGTHLEAAQSQRSWAEVATKERIAQELADFEEQVKKTAELADKHGIPRSSIFYFGIDEAQAAGTLRAMMPFRDIVFKYGMGSMTTGWEDNYRNSASHETYHTTAAFVDRKNAARWHAIGAQITSYAAPFIGPDNPELMRSSHGLRMFRHNYDGWWELAYEGGRYHAWNHRFGYDTTYRPFRFLTPTQKGPLVNTIAFRGMQRGQDDVRYATLMYQLADECFDSGKIENVIAARKAVNWFRNLEMPVPKDLDAVRAGMTHHILNMQKLLGKTMN